MKKTTLKKVGKGLSVFVFQRKYILAATAGPEWVAGSTGRIDSAIARQPRLVWRNKAVVLFRASEPTTLEETGGFLAGN